MLKSYLGLNQTDHPQDIACYKTARGVHVLIGGNEQGEIMVWDLQSQKLMVRKKVQEGAITTVDYHVESDTVVYGAPLGRAKLGLA